MICIYKTPPNLVPTLTVSEMAQYMDEFELQEAILRAHYIITELIDKLAEWFDHRVHLVADLRKIADEVDKYSRKSDVGKLTGSSAALAGTILAFVPPLSAIGLGLALGGAIATTGIAVSKVSVEGTKSKEAQQLLERDEKEYKEITSLLENMEQITVEACQKFPHLNRDEIQMLLLSSHMATKSGQTLGQYVTGIHSALISGATVPVALRTVHGVLLGGKTVAAAAGKVMAVVAVPLTAYDVITSILSLSNGTTSPTGDELRKISQTLEDGMKEFVELYFALT